MRETDSATESAGISDDSHSMVQPPVQKSIPYRHDPSAVPALARLADAACEGAEDLHEASLRLMSLAKDTDPPFDPASLRELTITFMYVLSLRPFMSAQPGAALVPLEGPSFPRSLRDADNEVHSLWMSLSSSTTHPAAKARCADIVFTLRLANGRNAAEEAIRNYLASGGGSLRVSEQGEGLLRAWELARSVGLSSMVQQVTSAMLNMVESCLDRQEESYVLVHLLDALSAPQRKKTAQPVDPRVDDLLDRALLSYPNTLVVSQIAALVRRRAARDDARVQHASKVEVKALLNDADRASDALVIRAHLNDAASRARQLNLPELEKIAVSRLQSAPPVEWKTIKSEFKIPNAYLRGYLRPFKVADTWVKALMRWFNTGSPSGKLANNEAAARNVLNQSVFSRLATTIVFGRGDLPKRVLSGDDDALQQELVRMETAQIHTHGMLLANALDIIRERFGIPLYGDLEDLIAKSGTHPVLARALAKGFSLYWVGEFDACVHLVVPKVEASARALLLELDEPMYRTAVGDGVGQFPGLGALLAPLTDNGFDPDWERFLRVFLLGDVMNVRNLVAHGFMDPATRETAALALRAYALLALITADQTVKRDSALVKAGLANPLGASPRPWRQRVRSALRTARSELLR